MWESVQTVEGNCWKEQLFSTQCDTYDDICVADVSEEAFYNNAEGQYKTIHGNTATCVLIVRVGACACTVLTPLTLLTLEKLSAPYDPTSEELIKTLQLPQSNCEA